MGHYKLAKDAKMDRFRLGRHVQKSQEYMDHLLLHMNGLQHVELLLLVSGVLGMMLVEYWIWWMDVWGQRLSGV